MALRREENVSRLDISMQDFVSLQIFESDELVRRSADILQVGTKTRLTSSAA